jgi:hypothetical protein
MKTSSPKPIDGAKSSSRRLWPVWALLAMAFVFFWQYFLLDQTIYAGDTAFVFFPFRTYATERLTAGQIPLWNPFLFGGTPTLAEPTYQIFYWPNLLFWITGVPRGIGWTLPLHVFWLSLGTYLFARRIGLGKLESLLAAVAFSYGGSVQGRLGIPVYTQAASWIPWMLIGYDIARRRGGLTLVLPGLALAMQLLTGGPPYTFYSLVLLVAFHLYHLRSHGEPERPGPPQRAWLALGATLVLGILLTAAQLVPEFELALLSDRGTKASYEYATWGSLEPKFLVTMVLPKFYGLFSTAAQQEFLPSTDLGYVGVLTLGLAVAAWFSERRSQVRFWLIVGCLSLFLAFGKHNPLYPFFYRFVPGVGMFRMPGCWLLITSFALAMIAAIGMETLRGQTEKRVVAARASAITLALMALGSAVLLLTPAGAGALAIAQTPFGPWGQVVFIALCVLPLAILGFRSNRAPLKLQRVVALSLPVLVSLDLFLVSQDMEMQQTLSVAAVEEVPATAKALQVSSDGRVAERFWSGTAQVPMEKWQTKNSDAESALDHRGRAAALTRLVMPSCLPAEFQTLGLTGAWGALMPLRRHARPIYQPNESRDVQDRWLRLLNVRTRLSLNPLDAPGLTLQSSEPIYLYRDDAALPRGFWVPSARAVKGDEAMSLLSKPSFDPRQEVLIEGDATSSVAPVAHSAANSFDPGRVRITQDKPEQIMFEVEAPSAGYVVLMDSAFPGWHAQVDGKEVPIQTANWMGRGVAVTEGSHRMDMWFDPMSVRFGSFISLLTSSWLVAWASSTWLQKRKKRLAA